MKGLVVFSFAQRSEEPSTCNIRLALAVERIVAADSDIITIAAQWEPARQLMADGLNVDLRIDPRPDGGYLGSEEVWEAARKLFLGLGITQVIPVAQPFLQLVKVKAMIEKDGFTVEQRHIGWIGFDRQSAQWWTRGPVRLLAYAAMQTLWGLRGYSGRQSPA